MAAKPLPAADVLHQLLRYDPEAGKLCWRERPVEMFQEGKQTAAHNAAIWNGKNAGREAFATALPSGHRYASIWRKKLLAHRVIWKMAHGTDPEIIDHIDGDPANNRLENLRSVTQQANTKNGRLSKNNTSGANGVRFEGRLGKWVARVSHQRRTIHVGVFDSLEDAVAAQREAASRLGFHPNHGRSA